MVYIKQPSGGAFTSNGESVRGMYLLLSLGPLVETRPVAQKGVVDLVQALMQNQCTRV